jgi:hypothetical protein
LLADAEGQWVRRWTGGDWFAEADGWVRERLASAGAAVTGEPVPYKIRFWAAVWCYPTDRGLFWFKENNPGQAFEAALVGAMAEALPQHVVAPLAIDRARGWLLTQKRILYGTGSWSSTPASSATPCHSSSPCSPAD